jgi:hypothetical protein
VVLIDSKSQNDPYAYLDACQTMDGCVDIDASIWWFRG